ncbi:MAG TPA: hypothetical protein VMF89_30270 [Polyangiales bacterium]|nr:hypothetical protein [Polyangiales bacterium]
MHSKNAPVHVSLAGIQVAAPPDSQHFSPARQSAVRTQLNSYAQLLGPDSQRAKPSLLDIQQ